MNSHELEGRYNLCKVSETGKSTLPFIGREIKRLKIIKNIELKKNYSVNNFALNLNLKKRKKNSNNLCKLYRYYFSKSKLEEKLMNQKIKKMKLDLFEKQEKKKKEYNYIFYKNYPPENENEYNNEIKDIINKIDIFKKNNNKIEMEKYIKIKNNFYTKKHDEYIEKMGKEFEKGYIILNEEFKKEKEEQNLSIKKIILNKQLKDLENNNCDFVEKNKKDINIFLSHFNLGTNNKDKKSLYDIKLKSRIFQFKIKENPYNTLMVQ